MRLQHGEPTWPYRSRKLIPPLVAAGHRVIAPDPIGFGTSVKFTAIDAYRYPRHADWLLAFIKALDLAAITLFGEGWGSLLGRYLAAGHPLRFDRIAVGNGMLPTGDGAVPSDAGKAVPVPVRRPRSDARPCRRGADRSPARQPGAATPAAGRGRRIRVRRWRQRSAT